MSTEYFFRWPDEQPCVTCGHTPTKSDIEIGHHGGGWRFQFKANREHGLVMPRDWIGFLEIYANSRIPGYIYDNNGHEDGFAFGDFMTVVSRSRGQRSRTGDSDVSPFIVTDGQFDIDLSDLAGGTE